MVASWSLIATESLPMSATSFTLPVAVVLAAALCFASPAVQARDINLGGKQEEPEKKQKPRNIIELPTIDLSLAQEDGGWRHIHIDAWLTCRDEATSEDLDKLRSTIVRLTQDALPDHEFDEYRSPRGGIRLVKLIIRQVTEKSLGRPLKGDVMIKNFLAY